MKKERKNENEIKKEKKKNNPQKKYKKLILGRRSLLYSHRSKFIAWEGGVRIWCLPRAQRFK